MVRQALTWKSGGMFGSCPDSARCGNPGEDMLVVQCWHADSLTGGWMVPQAGVRIHITLAASRKSINTGKLCTARAVERQSVGLFFPFGFILLLQRYVTRLAAQGNCEAPRFGLLGARGLHLRNKPALLNHEYSLIPRPGWATNFQRHLGETERRRLWPHPGRQQATDGFEHCSMQVCCHCCAVLMHPCSAPTASNTRTRACKTTFVSIGGYLNLSVKKRQKMSKNM
jgi:hypothetical protein